jgi:multisubunit Na+/H+ antiporter MnhC subunit
MAAIVLGLAAGLGLAMLGLLLGALAVALHQAGHSLPAALGLTALVAGLAMAALGLIARGLLRRALDPQAD